MFLNLLCLLFALFSSLALPCASCGGGGDDPLILYPNEKWKVYVGQSKTFNFKNISSEGIQVTEGGVTSKDQLTISGGVSFSERIFTTFTLPLIVNHIESSSRMAMGDPSFSTRYTFVLPSIAEPIFLPQLQLIFGFKPAIARSVRDSQDLKTLIDVFGTGFSEAKVGLDLWYGLYALKMGMALVLTQGFSRTFDKVIYSPSLGNILTLTTSYQWNQIFKTTVGINRDYKGELAMNRTNLENSDQLNHSVFMNQDFMLVNDSTLRLSYLRTAAILNNRNTSQINSLSIACMKSF